MKFSYDWTREDLKKELINKRFKVNIIFLLMGIFIYGYLMFIPFTSNAFDKKILIMNSLLYLVCYIIVLIIFTWIYIFLSLRKNDKGTGNAYGTYYVEYNDKNINVKIKDLEIKYNYKDISKFKVKKNRFFICTKEDKIGLLFKKDIIGEDNYNKLLKKIEKNIIL